MEDKCVPSSLRLFTLKDTSAPKVPLRASLSMVPFHRRRASAATSAVLVRAWAVSFLLGGYLKFLINITPPDSVDTPGDLLLLRRAYTRCGQPL